MAEDLHHDTLVNTLGEQQCGGGVPRIMNSHVTETRLPEECFPLVPVSVSINGPPVGLTPNEVTVVPGRPNRHALLELSRPVSLERRYQLRGKRDRAPALVGFQLSKAEPATGSFRARPSVSCAARLAVVAVAAFPTDVRITTAMSPCQALKLPANRQRSSVKIHVFPAKPERFSLPQSERERDAPPRAITALGDQIDDPLRFVQGERLDFVLRDRWGINQGGDISSDIAPLRGDSKRARQDALKSAAQWLALALRLPAAYRNVQRARA